MSLRINKLVIILILSSCNIREIQFYRTDICIRDTGIDIYNSEKTEAINNYALKIYKCCRDYSYYNIECEYIYVITRKAIITYINNY